MIEFKAIGTLIQKLKYEFRRAIDKTKLAHGVQQRPGLDLCFHVFNAAELQRSHEAYNLISNTVASL